MIDCIGALSTCDKTFLYLQTSFLVILNDVCRKLNKNQITEYRLMVVGEEEGGGSRSTIRKLRLSLFGMK